MIFEDEQELLSGLSTGWVGTWGEDFPLIVRLSRSMIIEARTGAILSSHPLRGLSFFFFSL